MLTRIIFPIFALVMPAVASATVAGNGKGVPDTGSVGAVVSMVLGLVVVLALIFGSAWLVRRVNGVRGVNNSAMRIVSVLAVGQRERILLLEVGGRQVLIGVTAHNIRTLHVFDEPVVTGSVKADSDFAAKLQVMLQKGFGAGDRGQDSREDRES